MAQYTKPKSANCLFQICIGPHQLKDIHRESIPWKQWLSTEGLLERFSGVVLELEKVILRTVHCNGKGLGSISKWKQHWKLQESFYEEQNRGSSHRKSASGRELFRKRSILSRLLPCLSLCVFTFVSKVNLTNAELLDVAKLASQKFIRAIGYYLNFFFFTNYHIFCLCDPLQKVAKTVKHPAQYDSLLLEISICWAENDSILHCESKKVFDRKLPLHSWSPVEIHFSLKIKYILICLIYFKN